MSETDQAEGEMIEVATDLRGKAVFSSVARRLESERDEARAQLAETQAKLEDSEAATSYHFSRANQAEHELTKVRTKLKEAEHYLKQKECTSCGGLVYHTEPTVAVQFLQERNLALSAALKQAREALGECHPAKIWDKARMFYTAPNQERCESISKWHSQRCNQAAAALAIPADLGVIEEVIQGLEKIAAMPWENSESPYAKIARQLLTALRGKETR